MEITHFRLRNKRLNFYSQTEAGLYTLREQNLDKYRELEKHKIFLNELQPFENFIKAGLSCFIHMDDKINLAECKFSYAGLCTFLNNRFVVSVENLPYVMIVSKNSYGETNVIASKLAGKEIKGKCVFMPLEHFRKLK